MNNITDKNYPAILRLSWLEADYQNIKVNCDEIFRGGQDKTSVRFQELLQAANESVSEIEDDINAIKAFLATYST